MIIDRLTVTAQVLQYYIHRFALHAPNSQLTKLHMAWQHSVRAPYAFVANYDHPLAWLVGRWLPLYLPAMVFRMHVLTFNLLLILVSLEEVFVYSGYSILPSNILLGGVARRQDAHLMSNGKGNFGPWGVLDWVHGTTIGDADVMDDIQEEMEKHHVDEKAGKAVEAGAGLIENVGSSLKGRGKGRPKKR
jgi:hypothetical protein